MEEKHHILQIEMDGKVFLFDTGGECSNLFSPRGLDTGTKAMLELADLKAGEEVCDIGCGWGPVGIYAAEKCGEDHVVMCDANPEAVAAARQNAVRNGFENIRIYESDAFDSVPDAGFDVILSNPPYHADFSVPRRFIEKGFNRLKTGGRMLMVTKRKLWYQNKLSAIFGGVRVFEKDGYFVFLSEKRSPTYANKAASGKKKKPDQNEKKQNTGHKAGKKKN